MTLHLLQRPRRRPRALAQPLVKGGRRQVDARASGVAPRRSLVGPSARHLLDAITTSREFSSSVS